jgi:photosystem II stability/assembly factor-like uncharacterized protein
MTTLLLIGTRKGAFVAESDASRHTWKLKGPFLKGCEVNHVGHLGNGRLALAGKSSWWGPAVQFSEDCGDSWHDAPGAIRFAEGRGHSVDRIWFVKPDPRLPHRLYAGVDPGALFVSEDDGAEWREVQALTDHPTRDKWFPGGGGLMVHSMVFDPARPSRLTVGVSAAGVFRSDDNGQSWTPQNTGLLAEFLPEKYPEVGQCVHHMEMHPRAPEIIYQQNHCGVYRSDNGGDSWIDISEGLPSRFGFPFAVLPRDGDTIFVVPEEGAEARMTPQARFGIYRSRDRGRSWELLTRGLPQSDAFPQVLRMAMTADAHDAAGVYVGTQGGQVLASRDGGDSWETIFNWLPAVYSLETAIL